MTPAEPPDWPLERALTPDDSTPGHLGLDRLSDLAEGLLDRDQAADARGHLERCQHCRTDRDALSDVQSDLADLTGRTGLKRFIDPPTPDDVVARLDSALAVEASGIRRSSSVTVVPAASKGWSLPGRWSSFALQAAVVLVVLLGVGGLAYSLLHSDSDSNSASDAAAGSAATAPTGKAGATPSRAAGGGVNVVRSGRDYTTATLASALAVVTGGAPNRASSPGLASGGPDSSSEGSTGGGSSSASPDVSSPLVSSPGALDRCLAGLHYTTHALGVDLATFQGSPAAVIVVPSEDDPTHVDVYAVAPTCPTGEFLSFARVARP